MAEARAGAQTADHFASRISEIFGQPEPSVVSVASSELNDWLAEAGQDDEIEVDVLVPVEPVFDAIDAFSRSVFVEVRDGRVEHSLLDGREATLDEIEASNAEMNGLLEQDGAERRARSLEAWNRLLESLHDEALAESLREASHQGTVDHARIRVTAKQLREFSGDAGSRTRRIEPSTPMENLSVDDGLAAIGLTGSTGYSGAGVEVWQLENSLPDLSHPWLNSSNVVYRGSTSGHSAGDGHATHMAAVILRGAFDSRVNWADSVAEAQSLWFPGRGAIEIANLSVGAAATSPVAYSQNHRALDEFIVAERVLGIQGSGNLCPSCGPLLVAGL